MKRSHSTLTEKATPPCLFAHWTELLGELQQEIAVRELDCFSRRALSLTCHAHYKQWFDLFPRGTTSPISREEMSHIMGRWAHVGYLKHMTQSYFLASHAIHGLVREGRDSTLHAFLSRHWTALTRKKEYMPVDSTDALIAFTMYGTEARLVTFLIRPYVVARNKEDGPLYRQMALRHGNIGYVSHALNGIDAKNIVLYTILRQSIWHHEFEHVPMSCDLLFKGPHAQDWIDALHAYPINRYDVVETAQVWTPLWPYLLTAQQDVYRRHVITECKESYTWTNHTSNLVRISDALGCIPLNIMYVQFHRESDLPWMDPRILYIMEQQWKHAQLSLCARTFEDLDTLADNYRRLLRKHSAAEGQAFLAWFEAHPFPGSDYIVHLLRAHLAEKQIVL